MNAPLDLTHVSTYAEAPMQAEYAVVGCLLTDPDAYSRIADLGLLPEAFADGELRVAYSVAVELIGAGKGCDVVAVFEASAAQGRGVPLQTLNDAAQSIASARSIRTHAETVMGAALERRIRTAALEAMDITRQPGTPREKLDRAQSLFAGIQAGAGKSVPRHVSEVAANCIARWEALADGSMPPGQPTRIPALDRMLNGGLREGKLIVLAARPGVGKSSFAEQIALTVAGDGWPALFLSQEMPAEEVTERAVSHLSRASYTQLQTGQIEDETWGRVSEGVECLRSLPFHIDDQPGLTLLDIRAKAMGLVRAGLKLLVVDYLQLCASSRKDGNRNLEVEEISRGLKTLAKEQGLCVVALSQLSRRVEERADQEPILSDLRDSGAVEQDADTVIFLWRPDRDEPSLVGCKVAKNRQGKLGRFALHFDGEIQRWGESTQTLERKAAARRGVGGFE